MPNPLELTVSKATKFFGEIPAVIDLSITVQPGEWVLILGHNGSGKSTFLRLLTKLFKSDTGTVLWRSSGGAQLDHEKLWSRMGYVSHQSLMYESLSVRENLILQMKLRGSSGNLEHAIQRLGLQKYADRPIRDLSQGIRGRSSLLAATIHEPDVLILDEPTAAFDDQGVEVLVGELERLRSVLGSPPTVLCASHDVARLSHLANRFFVFDAGRLVLDVGADRRAEALDRYRSTNR